ncbi:acyl carrier protein [Streptomyces hiroshimensis]|nr:acyl carrier protein [Streptomyces hiroshimensis]
MTHTPPATGTESVALLVTELVRLVAPRKSGLVEPDQRLVGDLGFHSLVLAELGYNLEELFSLQELSPEVAMTLERVGDVTRLIVTEVAEGRGTLPDADAVSAVFTRFGADGPAL